MPTSKKSAAHSHFINAVMDISLLESYLHVKHNETYVKLMTILQFNIRWKSMSVTVVLSVIGANNSVFNGWSWETY